MPRAPHTRRAEPSAKQPSAAAQSPRLRSFRTQRPGCGSGAPSWVPSPAWERRRDLITCPAPAAGAAGPGQARPLTPGGSGSAGCPAVRYGARTAATARGSSATAAPGRGPWSERAGLHAPAPTPAGPAVPEAELAARKPPEARVTRARRCLPEVFRSGPGAGA